jgi:hypothetical protein
MKSMALRDQKKDLDVLQKLGLKYGDTLPARRLLKRLYGVHRRGIHGRMRPIASAEFALLLREARESYQDQRHTLTRGPGTCAAVFR